MAHFAKIENGTVTQVLVITQDEVDTGSWGDPSSWVKTSYNTRGGVHYEPNSHTPSPDQSKALRKNYAGVGYVYDPVRDAFYTPQPYPSWSLDEQSCLWEAPVPKPAPDENGLWQWDEDTQAWVQAEGA